MAIEFVCPACGGTLQVGDESAGRVIRCGGCLTALRVPEADTRPAPPNPYDVDRPVQSLPARSTPVEPPAPAVPVEPRRRRDPDDPYDDRPRRRRPPAAPAGYGVFFWLVIIGAVMLVGVVGCCGAIFLALPDAKWQKHESKQGGFRVEVPGKVQPNAGKAAGIQLEGTKSEGAVLLKRAEQFFVFYRDVPSTTDRAKKVPAETDEQLIKKELEAVRIATEGRNLPPSQPVTVGGFDGREVEYMGKSGWYTVRVIVADTRVYVLLVCGMAEPGDRDVRRFIESFEITDPKLVEEGKRRAEQAKLAGAAKEREANRKAEEAEEQLRAVAELTAEVSMAAVSGARTARRELEQLRTGAEAVARAALAAALREMAAPRLPVAPAPRPVTRD